ncbi:hypothetical protein AAZX31_U041400 [Glycine max]
MSASWFAWLFEALKLSLRACSRVILSRPSRIVPTPLPFTLDKPSTKRIHQSRVVCRFRRILPKIQSSIASSWGRVVRIGCQTLKVRWSRPPSFLRVQDFSKSCLMG